MYGSEFAKIFAHFPIVKKQFIGAFSIDTMPSTIKVNEFFICNTANSTEEGTHWFVVYKADDDLIELFDCLVPALNTIKKLKVYKCEIETNEVAVMSRRSDICGEMSAYFCINRVMNPNEHLLDIICDFFTTNNKENEDRVKKFIQNM